MLALTLFGKKLENLKIYDNILLIGSLRMSGKSILLSILSVLLFIGVVFVIAFAFSFNILIGFASILLTIFPTLLQRKALSTATGILDRIIAKFIVPVLFVLGALGAIFGIAFWLELFF